ncbi:MAG: hypothetical protein RI900_159 [Actinomycetota bacterium]|jgi:hypothetical protein
MSAVKSRLVRANVFGTALFVVAEAIAVPLRAERVGQVLIAVVSLVLFAAGVATSLWAYASALERSRSEEVGVANLYLLTGDTAPAPVKRTMSIALGTQVVVGLAGAIIGVAGLSKNDLNALAFGALVPMLGIGMNGAWAARYGSYGPRVPVPKAPRRNE